MVATMAFGIIFGTATAALFAAPWSVIVVSALALALVSLIEHRRYQARFASAGLSQVFQTFALSNAAISVIASASAYGLGLVVRTVMFA